MPRNRSVREESAVNLERRIRAETVLVPLDIIAYNNFEAVQGGALPIELPGQGLTPEYCVYAVSPAGYRVHIFSEFGLDQLKADRPDLERNVDAKGRYP